KTVSIGIRLMGVGYRRVASQRCDMSLQDASRAKRGSGSEERRQSVERVGQSLRMTLPTHRDAFVLVQVQWIDDVACHRRAPLGKVPRGGRPVAFAVGAPGTVARFAGNAEVRNARVGMFDPPAELTLGGDHARRDAGIVAENTVEIPDRAMRAPIVPVFFQKYAVEVQP